MMIVAGRGGALTGSGTRAGQPTPARARPAQSPPPAPSGRQGSGSLVHAMSCVTSCIMVIRRVRLDMFLVNVTRHSQVITTTSKWVSESGITPCKLCQNFNHFLVRWVRADNAKQFSLQFYTFERRIRSSLREMYLTSH